MSINKLSKDLLLEYAGYGVNLTKKQSSKLGKMVFKAVGRRIKFERKYQKYLQKRLMQSAKFFAERGFNVRGVNE